MSEDFQKVYHNILKMSIKCRKFTTIKQIYVLTFLKNFDRMDYIIRAGEKFMFRVAKPIFPNGYERMYGSFDL